MERFDSPQSTVPLLEIGALVLEVMTISHVLNVHRLLIRSRLVVPHALLGVFVRVAQLRRRAFTLRCDDDTVWDERRCLFLSFNNSKYTGGTMLIAPNADPSDALIEFVRWGPIGRLGLLRMLPKLYDGTHIHHPLASRRAVRRVEFNVPAPIDVMIDGEIANLEIRSLDIIPAALDVHI